MSDHARLQADTPLILREDHHTREIRCPVPPGAPVVASITGEAPHLTVTVRFLPEGETSRRPGEMVLSTGARGMVLNPPLPADATEDQLASWMTSIVANANHMLEAGRPHVALDFVADMVRELRAKLEPTCIVFREYEMGDTFEDRRLISAGMQALKVGAWPGETWSWLIPCGARATAIEVLFVGPKSEASQVYDAMRARDDATTTPGAAETPGRDTMGTEAARPTKKISVSACPDRDYVYVGGAGGAAAERLTAEEARELGRKLYQEADALAGRTTVPGVWRSDDPRTAIDSRGGVVVVIWTASRSALFGIVRTQGAHHVALSSLRRITEDEAWPEGWLWTLAPEVKP